MVHQNTSSRFFGREEADQVISQLVNNSPFPLDINKMEFVQSSLNVTFFHEDLVIRISPKRIGENTVQDHIDFAKHLYHSGFPTPEALIKEPLLVDNHWVTFTRKIADAEPAICSPESLGKLVQEFHRISDDYQKELPAWDYFIKIEERFDHFSDYFQSNPRDEEFLREVLEDLRNKWDELPSTSRMPVAIIHGDLHLLNVLTAGDEDYLIDFDGLAYGPREVDFSKIVLLENKEYAERFLSASDISLEEYPGIELVAEMNLLAATFRGLIPEQKLSRGFFEKGMSYWKSDQRDIIGFQLKG